jgi:hypothetical protein
MASPNETDLTYGEFVKLRAAALSTLHAAESFERTSKLPQFLQTVPSAALVAHDAVVAAELQLAQVLDRWARSKFNRSV